jgi:hypothetical protein
MHDQALDHGRRPGVVDDGNLDEAASDVETYRAPLATESEQSHAMRPDHGEIVVRFRRNG